CPSCCAFSGVIAPIDSNAATVPAVLNNLMCTPFIAKAGTSAATPGVTQWSDALVGPCRAHGKRHDPQAQFTRHASSNSGATLATQHAEQRSCLHSGVERTLRGERQLPGTGPILMAEQAALSRQRRLWIRRAGGNG